jgi:proline dehydrogenase
MNSKELTVHAFDSFSKNELKRKLFYLKLLRVNALLVAGKLILSVFNAINFPIAWIFRKTIFPQFCAGQNLEEASRLVNILGAKKLNVILDYSVEGVNDDESFNRVVDEIIRNIDFAASSEFVPFAVFKPTAIASVDVLSGVLDENSASYTVFRERLRIIANHAATNNVKLLIDAEDFEYQQIVDTEVELLMREFNSTNAVVFNTIQMYRNDRPDYLKYLIELGKTKGFKIGVKLVRGAYMEKERNRAKQLNYESPIFDTKSQTDGAYNSALKYIVENIDVCELFAGSHNEYSNQYLTELMDKFSLAKKDKRIYFAQLYGMADAISNTLAYSGYNVVKYIPYGPVKEVIPYLMRRADENSSLSEQSKKEIELLRIELKRRKNDDN